MKIAISLEITNERELRALLEDLKDVLPPGAEMKVKITHETVIVKQRQPAETPLEQAIAAAKMATEVARTA